MSNSALLLLCSGDVARLEEALEEARLLIDQGIRVCVFIYQDAAILALHSVFEPRLNNVQREWAEFASANQIELGVCVASALARGVTDEDNARRHKLFTPDGAPFCTLKPGFTLTGLGSLAELVASCETSRVFS